MPIRHDSRRITQFKCPILSESVSRVRTPASIRLLTRAVHTLLLLRRSLLALPPGKDEVIVFTVASPRAGWHVAHFHKLPIRNVDWRKTEVIPDGRGNVQACAMIGIRLWPLIWRSNGSSRKFDQVGHVWIGLFAQPALGLVDETILVVVNTIRTAPTVLSPRSKFFEIAP